MKEGVAYNNDYNSNNDVYLEQYKIVWELVQSELRRFWVGFHVLSVLKVAMLSVVSSIFRIDTIEDFYRVIIVICTSFFVIILAGINIKLNKRAQNIYKDCLESIIWFEKKIPQLSITELIVQSGHSDLKKNSNPVAMEIANWLPICILIISLLVLFYNLYVFIISMTVLSNYYSIFIRDFCVLV